MIKENEYQLPTCECLRCGHKWHPAKSSEPRVCAKCHSPYWNKPKTKFKKQK